MGPRPHVRRVVVTALVLAAMGAGAWARQGDPPRRQVSGTPALPNIVIVFADDLGYGDLGTYGATGYATPNLDRLAAEGARFTSFYAAQAVCSASRAALLTGAYPNRIGISGALFPHAKIGLDPGERTIAEVVKARGYATAIVGKWHLGDLTEFLPSRHGFDEYYGLPYSNDMWPGNANSIRKFPPLPLIDGTRVFEENPDQDLLTARYTARAVSFIERNAERPFFLYLAHSMPHVPLHASARFRGTTARGAYGDVVSEIDWSVGRLLETLQRLDLDSRTLVVFTSDNGPWLIYGNHAGSAGPLREGKSTTFEGGVRVPAIARWPGRIPPGRTIDALATTMDLLPTVAGLVGAPAGPRTIDGKDIWPLLAGQSTASPHDAFFYYWNEGLEAVRSGKWKLHLPHEYFALDPPSGADGRPSRYATRRIGLSLFDLDADLGETKDVASENPDVVARLQRIAERARVDLGDSLTGRKGAHVRPPGRAAR